jgi:hypothetical protein
MFTTSTTIHRDRGGERVAGAAQASVGGEHQHGEGHGKAEQPHVGKPRSRAIARGAAPWWRTARPGAIALAPTTTPSSTEAVIDCPHTLDASERCLAPIARAMIAVAAHPDRADDDLPMNQIT